jgi:hypothetical protein
MKSKNFIGEKENGRGGDRGQMKVQIRKYRKIMKKTDNGEEKEGGKKQRNRKR